MKIRNPKSFLSPGRGLQHEPVRWARFSAGVDPGRAISRGRHLRSLAVAASLLFVLCLVPASAPAEIITGVSIAGVSSQLQPPYGSFDRIATHIIDGSGLAGDGSHSQDPDGTMWESVGNPIDLNPFITFDLGLRYDLDFMRIWNYNERSTMGITFTLRGVQNATLSISDDNLNYVSLGTITLQQGNPLPDFSQIVSVGAAGRYVRLSNLVNFGDLSGHVGLSEVQFIGTIAPVPEPATISLLGIGAMALLVRRRKTQ